MIYVIGKLGCSIFSRLPMKATHMICVGAYFSMRRHMSLWRLLRYGSTGFVQLAWIIVSQKISDSSSMLYHFMTIHN
jgi:hypothetical protein